MKAVMAQPDDLIGCLTNQSPDAPVHFFRRALQLRIDVDAKLPVNAPDALRLGVDQDGIATVGGVIKKETRLRGKIKIGPDVRDQEEIIDGPAREFQIEELAQAAARAVTSQHIFCGHFAAAFRRLNSQRHLVGGLQTVCNPLIPAQLDQRVLADALSQEVLNLILREIDITRQKARGWFAKILNVDLALPEVGVPDPPGHPQSQHILRGAQLFPDRQRGLVEGDGPRTIAELVIVIQNDAVDTVMRQVKRGSHPGWTGPHDQDRFYFGRAHFEASSSARLARVRLLTSLVTFINWKPWAMRSLAAAPLEQ